MSVFDDFENEEIDFLVSMPWRVGMWVSQADDVKGTDKDDKRERRALESILKGLSKSRKQKPFASAVVQETLTYGERCSHWEKKLEATPEDARRAVALVQERMSVDHVPHYRNALMQVGVVVAQAYNELDAEKDLHENESLLMVLIDKVVEAFSAPALTGEHPENISPAEKAALKKLADALKD